MFAVANKELVTVVDYEPKCHYEVQLGEYQACVSPPILDFNQPLIDAQTKYMFNSRHIAIRHDDVYRFAVN